MALIATIWSASKGVMALMRGLNAINGVQEKRNYFVVRVIASFYTLVMLIVVILSLFLMVFGDQLVTLTLHRIPQLQRVVSFAMNFRFLLVWAVLSVLFAAVYAYVPDKKLAFREQVPGAVFSSVVWSVFSWAFSYYVTYGNTYGIYGSLSIIIIVLLWMYFCMYIILIGAEPVFCAGKQSNGKQGSLMRFRVSGFDYKNEGGRNGRETICMAGQVQYWRGCYR